MQTLIWRGCDVSKDTFDASCVPVNIHIDFLRIPHQKFPRTRIGVREFKSWIADQAQKYGHQSQRTRVVMEATGRYSLELFGWMMKDFPTCRPAIINPRQAAAHHRSLGLRNTTDGIDCRALRIYGRERSPEPYQAPDPQQYRLRELTRQRFALIKEQNAERARIKEPGHCKFVVRIQQSHIKHLNKLIEKIEAEMLRIVEGSEQLKTDVNLLITIPGVGLLTAMIALGELGDLRRFKRSRQISAMVGVSPPTERSGKSVRKRSRMSKSGNAHVRAALYMPALSACRGGSKLGRFFLHLVEDLGIKKKAAVGAVMRKMLVIMRAVVINHRPYSDEVIKGPAVENR